MEMTTPPAFQTAAGNIGLVYDFTPAGATFNEPVTIRFSYDPALIPDGVSASSLQIAFYDSTQNAWTTLPSIVDTNGHFISAQTTHFTPYAVTYGVKAVTQVLTTNTTTTVKSTTTTSTGGTEASTINTTQTTQTTSTTTPLITTSTSTLLQTATPVLSEFSSTTITSGVKTTVELPTTTDTPLSTNIPSVRMAILALAIGIALLLIIVTSILIRQRQIESTKKSGRLK
jgi:hypothetical protein